MKHIGTFSLILACSGLPSLLAGQSELSARPAGSYQPFTAQINSTYWDESGGKVSFMRTFARRGDGSYADDGDSDTCGERSWVRYIFDSVKRFVAKVSSYTRSAHIAPLVTESRFRGVLEFHGSCRMLQEGAWEVVGESERLGFRVLEIQHKGGDDWTRKKWVAPELACFALLSLLIEPGNIVRTREEVLSLELGEPDPRLFEIPSDVEWITPLEELRRFETRCHWVTPDDRRMMERLEREYQEAKPHWRGPFRLP